MFHENGRRNKSSTTRPMGVDVYSDDEHLVNIPSSFVSIPIPKERPHADTIGISRSGGVHISVRRPPRAFSAWISLGCYGQRGIEAICLCNIFPFCHPV